MNEDFGLLSDLHKDARGFRPGAQFMQSFAAKTYNEQLKIWEDLNDELERSLSAERDAEADALRVFQRRLDDMVADYGIDIATALRWDMDAFEVDVSSALAMHGSAIQEIEFYLWKQGIAFSEFPRFVAIVCAAYDLTEHGTAKEMS